MAIKYSGLDFKRVARKIKKQAKHDIPDEVVRELTALGKEARNHYRANGEYRDETGALRNSSAYAIDRDGQTITAESSNEYGRKGIEGDEPITRGIRLRFATGAPYARHVENKGRNVMAKTARYIDQEGVLRIRKAIRRALEQ